MDGSCERFLVDMFRVKWLMDGIINVLRVECSECIMYSVVCMSDTV